MGEGQDTSPLSYFDELVLYGNRERKDTRPPTQQSAWESFMMDFYRELLINQQPLEKEFEEALYEHLWGLYVRS